MTSQAIIRSRVQSLTRKHAKFSTQRLWLQYIYDTFDVNATTRIGYVHKHQYQTACVFTIQQYGEVVTPHVAASAAGIIAPDATSTSDEGPIDLETTLKYWDNAILPPHLCMSDSFTDDDVLVIRWNDVRTLYSTYKAFKDKLSSLVTLQRFDVSSILESELAITRTSSDDTKKSTAMLAHLVNLNYQHHSEAMTYQLAKAQNALQVAQTAESKLDKTVRKLGYINEGTWRQRLGDEEGVPWSKNFQFDSLSELVDWVGMKMKQSRAEKQLALKTIVLLCIDNFDGFPGTESISWSDMDAYRRLYWWATYARQAKGFVSHPYKHKVIDMLLRFQYHENMMPAEEKGITFRMLVASRLMHEDSKLALTMFLMLIDPSTYEPKIGTPLSEWSTPQTEYEFDHQGAFKEIEPRLYYYDGAKSKLSYSLWREARAQPESRIRLIDGVANLGYRMQVVYSLRIYVPVLPTTSTETNNGRTITVMRCLDDSIR